MKTVVTLLTIFAATIFSFAQGNIIFANTSTTLISVNGNPMPIRTNINSTYYFAVFIAPSTTVNGSGNSSVFWNDPAFQIVGAYTTNTDSVSTNAPGRLPFFVPDVGGTPGSTVDYLVRGWSANAGSTWGEALANWNNGLLAVSGYFGQSVVGDNLTLGGGPIPVNRIFGVNSFQIPGFNLLDFVIPEPSGLALTSLGAAGVWLFRRRSPCRRHGSEESSDKS